MNQGRGRAARHAGANANLAAVRLDWPTDNVRPVMQERPRSEFELLCELVLLALGFLGPELDTVIAQLGCELTERGNLKARPDYQTTVPACSRAATRGGASRSSCGRSGRAGRPRAGSTRTSWARRSCRRARS